jgi:hypothetical protein
VMLYYKWKIMEKRFEIKNLIFINVYLFWVVQNLENRSKNKKTVQRKSMAIVNFNLPKYFFFGFWLGIGKHKFQKKIKLSN